MKPQPACLTAHLRHRLPALSAISLWGALLLPLAAQALNPEREFVAAREAFRNGNVARLDVAVKNLQGSELLPWAESYDLRMHMDEPGGDTAILDFLGRHTGSYPAEKLRGDWLKFLGKRQQWTPFRREWAALQQPDADLRCYDWQERLTRNDAAVFDEARPVWLNGGEMGEACAPVTDAMVRDKRFTTDDIWARVRRLLEADKRREARYAARYLPDSQISDAKLLESLYERPTRYLDKLPNDFDSNRRSREQALYALQRVAKQDPSDAASRLRALEGRLEKSEAAYAWGQIALQAARRHMADAQGWFDKSAGAALNDEQQAWRIRVALRATDWTNVRRAIEGMTPALADQPEWIYWLGRARAAQGRKDEAAQLYRRIAGQNHFYGVLADEELGRTLALPAPTTPPTTEELALATTNPGLRRALALMRLDLRTEGVREWNWSLRGMNDRQLLAAAELARRNDVLDRAISAADRTRDEHDFSLRFPAPFHEEVSAKAQELALDDGWVYGLIRQESRFVMSAQSGVGARGLMQVMPATARWVAKKIGLKDYHPDQMTDTRTNVNLGTNYLKMVLSRLDNNPVLACAAYNAGPGRAERWRGDRPMEGAIYAETIPFTETRDYVKKVMSNAVHYAALFQGKPQSLKARMGTVPPRNGADSVVDDLP